MSKDIIKIFLGTDGNSGDSPELVNMGHRAKKNGFVLRKTTEVAQPLVERCADREVVIRGGLITHCIPDLISIALDRGAKKVTVNLCQCRGTEEEERHPLDQVKVRRVMLEIGLGRQATDPRLTILPRQTQKKK